MSDENQVHEAVPVQPSEYDQDIANVAQEVKTYLTVKSKEFIERNKGKRRIKIADICVPARKNKLLYALGRTYGIVAPACRAVGISRSVFYKYINEDPEFAMAVKIIMEESLDFVEFQNYKNIARGDIASTIFYLKTKGRERGYIEKIDHNVNHSDQIKELTDEQLSERIKQQRGAISSAEGAEKEATPK